MGKIKEKVETLTSFDQVQTWLQNIVNHHNDVYPAILDIADFFNHVYRGTEELDDGGIYYQINDSKIISVVYNTTTIDITYKTVNNEERTIKFHTNFQRGSTEVNGPVIQLVSYNDVQDDGDYDTLTVGDAYISNNKLYIVTSFNESTPVVKEEPLKVNVLYLRKTGNKIYYYDGEEVHEFSIGGGSSVEFDEEFSYTISKNSNNAVKAKDLWDAYQTVMDTIQGLDANKKTLNGLETVDADGESFEVFNYTKGNPGLFKFDKQPEEITVEEIKDCLHLKFPYGYEKIEDIPVIDSALPLGIMTEGLFTASFIGLVTPEEWRAIDSGSELDEISGASKYNLEKLKLAIANPKCIGVYLDKMYYIYPIDSEGNVTQPSTTTGPKGYHDNSIVIDKDFFIVGSKTNSLTVNPAGFIAYSNLFYTDKSLVLYNIKITKRSTEAGKNRYSVYVNTENVVDQLQVINCSLGDISEDNAIIGYGLYIYSPNTIPYKLERNEHIDDGGSYKRTYNNEYVYTRKVSDYNYINHINITDNRLKGQYCINSYNVRNVKSCRVTSNLFYEFKACPLQFEVYNFPASGETINNNAVSYTQHQIGTDETDKTWISCTYALGNKYHYMAQTKAYMSCPRYIAGNNFVGNNYVMKPINKYAPYYCAALLEGSTDYFLHNTIENLISGVREIDDAICYNPTYDIYANVQQLFYSNNYIKNIVRFDDYSKDISAGVCKGKSLNITLVSGGVYDKPLHRYYKKNEYFLDKAEVSGYFNTYYDNLAEGSNEKEYNTNLLTEDNLWAIYSIHFARPEFYDAALYQPVSTTIGRKPLLKEFVFSENIVDAGDGSIWGGKHNNPYPTALFECNNNTFKAKRFVNEEFDVHFPNGYGHIFPIRLASTPMYGISKLIVKHNKFIDNATLEHDAKIVEGEKHCNLRFISNFYYTSEENGSNCVSRPEGDISIIEDNSFDSLRDVNLIINGINKDYEISPIKTIQAKKVDEQSDKFLEYVYGYSRFLMPTSQPANPTEGSRYITLVDGVAKVKRYSEGIYPIIMLRTDSYLKTISSDVQLNLSNITLPLSSEINISPVTVSQLKSVVDDLDHDNNLAEYRIFANAFGLTENNSKTEIKAALNNISSDILYTIKAPNSSYTHEVSVQMMYLFKFILKCNGYSFVAYVTTSDSNKLFKKEDTKVTASSTTNKFVLRRYNDTSLGRYCYFIDILADTACSATYLKNNLSNDAKDEFKKVYSTSVVTIQNTFIRSDGTQYNFGHKAYQSRIGNVEGWKTTTESAGVVGKLFELESSLE